MASSAAASRYKLSLLGPPGLEYNGQAIELGRRKALALLAYLAITGKGHSRERLATMLWPEAQPAHSRAALRRVLSDLNKALGGTWVSATANVELRPDFDIWIDAVEFRQLLSDCQGHAHAAGETCPDCLARLTRAADLYRDHFLSGFSLPDSSEFDEWQFFEGETAERQLSQVLEILVNHGLAQVEQGATGLENIVTFARRWVALESLSEAPRLALMQLYAWTRQPAAALRQYREYTRLLDQELGETPGEEVRRLYERLRKEQVARPTAESVKSSGTTSKQTPTLPDNPPFEETRTPLAGYRPEDEIRLATALFVGLSSQSTQAWEPYPEKVAEAARTLVDIVHQIVLKYNAQAERFMGQGMFVIFGLPHLHEDDAERALRAALEIQEAARSEELDTTIGACTGQIYYINEVPVQDAAAVGLPPDALVVGPALNQATRMQNLAAPNHILVSQSTYRQTQRAFEFVEMHPDYASHQTPAGQPVESIYQLMCALESPEKARDVEGLRGRLIGREEELSKLRATLQNTLDGQGSMVTLIGEAGIGKSRLAAELKQTAISAWEQGALLLWLESRCIEWRMPTSYWPIIDLFNNLLYFFAAEEDGDRSRSLVTLLDEMYQHGDFSQVRMQEIGALLGNLLSIHFGNDWDELLKNASPTQVQRQTFQATYDFLTALARQQPLVLIFEDLQWADDLSLDLLSLWLEAILTCPILLICLYRPGQAHQGRRLVNIANQKIPQRYIEINLRELLPEQSLHLVQSLLGEPAVPVGIDTSLVEEFFVQKSWGNPFFVEEAVRTLVDQGILYRQDNHWQMSVEPTSLAVPESVQSIILSRVDRLEPDLKSVLRSAAVLGTSFSTSILAQIIPPHIRLESALLALEETALLYRQRVMPEIEYSFKHTLIQEVVYQTIASRQRAELHRQAAQAIEHKAELYRQEIPADDIEPLAYHYQRSPVSEKAIEYLLKAGEKARCSYRNREAIEYFKQALERWKPARTGGRTAASAAKHTLDPQAEQNSLRWKLAALTGLGQIYHGMGNESEAEKYILQAIAVGQAVELETPALVRLYYWLGEVLHWQRRYNEQIHLGQAGLNLLTEGQAETLEAALMNQIIAIGHLGRGDEAAFQNLTHTTATFIQNLPYSEELRPAYVHIILSLYNNRQVEQATQWLAKLQSLAETHHDLRALAEVYDYQWGYRFQNGSLCEALENCQRALELYPKIGDTFRVWRCQRDMAWGYLMLGNLSSAQHYASLSLCAAQQLQSAAFESESWLIIGLINLCQFDYAQAAAAFQSASQPTRAGDVAWAEWMAVYCLGQISLRLGNAQVAIEHFYAAMERKFPYHVPLGWWFNRWPVFTCLLSGLEEAYAAAASELNYQALRDKFSSIQTHSRAYPFPEQWQLEPVPPPASRQVVLDENFILPVENGWNWIDTCGDSSLHIGAGAQIRAANGRDMWHLNQCAPRLLRPINASQANDFAIQTCLTPANLTTPGQADPCMGGLLLWKDTANFLRLVWGTRGIHELSFEGCIDNQNVIVGRGRLPLSLPINSKIVLRLERQDQQVQASCALTNGENGAIWNWFGLGQVAFPVNNLLQVGLHAVGWIDRTIYHGAYPAGSQICFENFQLLAKLKK